MASLALGGLLAVHAVGAPAIPHYVAGDIATADVSTPRPLVVFDPVGTETLRQAEAAKVPAIFRMLADAPQQADRSLRDAFESLRAEFVSRLAARFGHPVPLLTAERSQPAYREIVRSFQADHPTFPLSGRLEELWAFGNAGDAALDNWRDRLKQFTRAYPYLLPDLPGEQLEAPVLRIIDVQIADRKLSLDTVDRQGRNVARTNFVALSSVRQEAIQTARNSNVEEQAIVAFLAGFIAPSCLLDLELTRQARAHRTEAVHVADRYAAGETIVKEGAEITPKILRALDELQARASAEQAVAQAAVAASQRAQAEAALAMARDTVVATTRTNRWLRGGLAAVAMLGLALAWVWRSRRRRARLAERDSGLVILSNAAPNDAPWRDRALAAEAKAEKAAALLRSSLLPHMARWMMNELVQRLLSQRSAMATSQQQAESEMAELVQRLDRLHAPLEDRLRAYEKRIAELEAELAAKGQQNAELIKAKIETTRKKMEVERGQEPLTWN